MIGSAIVHTLHSLLRLQEHEQPGLLSASSYYLAPVSCSATTSPYWPAVRQPQQTMYLGHQLPGGFRRLSSMNRRIRFHQNNVTPDELPQCHWPDTVRRHGTLTSDMTCLTTVSQLTHHIHYLPRVHCITTSIHCVQPVTGCSL